MTSINKYCFPFGQVVHPVEQTEHNPKQAFVLGVYASAVHARWIDNDGKQLVAALAVASEPEIFWTGHDAQQQIDKINIPEEVGKLVLPAFNLNGPSGRALGELYLKPLGLSRKDAWLCDLIPETRLNPHQKNAINRFYKPLMKKFNLPKVTILEFRQWELNSENRRQAILEELYLSQSETLILLGDLPIKWFLNYFSDKKFENLSQFGNTKSNYGLDHELKLSEKTFKVIPLCHPRQAQRLGASSISWYELHNHWVKMKSKISKPNN
jgi:hypothetical protein